MKILLGLIAALCIAPASAGDRGGQFQNLDRMIEDLNLRPYFQNNYRPQRSLKIAIFDNGFQGAQAEIGRSLPANTIVHKGPVPIEGQEEVHGLYMGKILWSLLSLGGTDERYRPTEFHLYNTFGYSNLKAAVEDARRRRVDIILYSQTWEYGGNFDGGGFINGLVDQAVKSGILWINNAGNFGNSTFNGAVANGPDDWIKLPGRNSSVEIRCEKNPTNKCLLRSVLSWNSFSDDVERGTDKDLDFVLTDDTLNIVQGSSLSQKLDAGNEPGTSKYPREILTAELKPGQYFLRVKNRSKNFSRQDRLRITVSGDFITMPQSDRAESLLPPADNPGVITVGALDSERSSRSTRLKKPELLTNSLVSLNAQENFKGSSNSAAMVAAGAAILFSLDPGMTRTKFLASVGRSSNLRVGSGLSLGELGFAPDSRSSCFKQVATENLPLHVSQALALGGTLVSTNAGWKVFFSFDPIRLLRGISRYQANDILVMTDTGPGVFSRSGLWDMPSNMIELVQTPYGQSICSSNNGSTWSRVFRLP